MSRPKAFDAVDAMCGNFSALSVQENHTKVYNFYRLIRTIIPSDLDLHIFATRVIEYLERKFQTNIYMDVNMNLIVEDAREQSTSRSFTHAQIFAEIRDYFRAQESKCIYCGWRCQIRANKCMCLSCDAVYLSRFKIPFCF